MEVLDISLRDILSETNEERDWAAFVYGGGEMPRIQLVQRWILITFSQVIYKNQKEG